MEEENFKRRIFFMRGPRCHYFIPLFVQIGQLLVNDLQWVVVKLKLTPLSKGALWTASDWILIGHYQGHNSAWSPMVLGVLKGPDHPAHPELSLGLSSRSCSQDFTSTCNLPVGRATILKQCVYPSLSSNTSSFRRFHLSFLSSSLPFGL